MCPRTSTNVLGASRSPRAYARASRLHVFTNSTHAASLAPYGRGYSHSPNVTSLSKKNRTVVPPALLTWRKTCNAHASGAPSEDADDLSVLCVVGGGAGGGGAGGGAGGPEGSCGANIGGAAARRKISVRVFEYRRSGGATAAGARGAGSSARRCTSMVASEAPRGMRCCACMRTHAIAETMMRAAAMVI